MLIYHVYHIGDWFNCELGKGIASAASHIYFIYRNNLKLES